MTSLLTLPVFSETAVGSSEPSPTASVKSALSELIQILDDQDLNHPGRSEERRLQIERTLRSHVSYEEMAKRSLGNPWTSLNDAERREFADLFVQFLAKSVSGWKIEREPSADGINDAHDELVTYLSEQRVDRLSEVRTRLRSLKVDTFLDFRLVNQSGAWRVYDVVVDRVSVAGNYRAQFGNIVRLFSLAELEHKIKTIVPILKLFEKTAPR
jgi:ABC-type transporter MlaC component